MASTRCRKKRFRFGPVRPTRFEFDGEHANRLEFQLHLLEKPTWMEPRREPRKTMIQSMCVQDQECLDDDGRESKAAVRVLCVDLDGSLIASDLLHESFLGLMRTRPLDALQIPIWLLRGRAYLKRQLAERAAPDVRALPYHDDVVAYLRSQRDEGRRLVLATAADERLARGVAEHLGLFDNVIASDGKSNLKGQAKLRAIEAQYGRGGFDYIGNAWEDLPIWESAGAAVIVRPSQQLLAKVRSRRPNALVFARSGGTLVASLKMLRVHQWAKNLLLFVPLIAAHRLGDWRLILAVLVAFFAFSFGASAIYIVNDLIDLPSDRTHFRKRSRPLASGRIPISAGLATFPLLLGASIALAALLPLSFLGILLFYLATSTAYTFLFKKKLLIDVLCLAGLYTLRILAGGSAIGVEITTWLMAFSMFFFLSLAFVKRYTELDGLGREHRGFLSSRGYCKEDLELIRAVGPASGYMAVLVLCLYLNDPLTSALYHHPKVLWLLCPMVLYWITRVWFLAQRGQLHSDPIVFALTDWRSLATGVIGGGIVVAATI
jgi:4-hydroxybenzoate polyprenyltransferase/phosphoserine phosphatase